MTSEEKSRMISVYSSWATAIASRLYKISPHWVDFEEVRGWAMLGLCEAINKYNPEIGSTFKGYATFVIRGAIFDGFRTWLSHKRHHKPQMFSLDTGTFDIFEAWRTHPSNEELSLNYVSQKDLIVDESADVTRLDSILFIREVLSQLSFTERESLTMKYLYGFTDIEVAEKTGRSVRMQREIGKRARDNFREVLGGYGITSLDQFLKAA